MAVLVSELVIEIYTLLVEIIIIKFINKEAIKNIAIENLEILQTYTSDKNLGNIFFIFIASLIFYNIVPLYSRVATREKY